MKTTLTSKNNPKFKFIRKKKSDKYAITSKNGGIFNPETLKFRDHGTVALHTKDYLTWDMRRNVGHVTMNATIEKYV